MISSIVLKSELGQREKELERNAHQLAERACLARENLHRVEIAAAEARGALAHHRSIMAVVLAQREIVHPAAPAEKP